MQQSPCYHFDYRGLPGDWVVKDSDFDSIRDDPRFMALLEGISEKQA